MITLLSDFGCKDVYVAVMKGVIAAIAPAETTCDLTHALQPQDILAARFHLMVAYPYFPVGTVHLAVVDPGVGSTRRAIALRCRRGFLVGPDNGLFGGVLQHEEVLAAVALTNADYWRSPQPSHTFHGRDIFAPAAAHLAMGVPIEQLGDRIAADSLVEIAVPSYQPFAQPTLPSFVQPFGQFSESASMQPDASLQTESEGFLGEGALQYIDNFGNLITNIPAVAVPTVPWELVLMTPRLTYRLAGHQTYSDVPQGALLALVGSHGWVEIACRGGSAATVIENIEIGQPVKIRVMPASA
jgi:S-adenosyl-L-methionine hydrolase (adenosine-forming)